VAWRGLLIFREVIIHRKLLAFADFAQAHVEDVHFHDARDQIGATTMVDVLGAAAAHRAIQYPITIEREVICAISMSTLLAGDRADALPRIFDHFTIGGNGLSRLNSAAVDA
jgi:hypothetical protein